MSHLASLNLLSDDERYEGFDLQAGKTWIYPTNYPLRDYQFNIIQEALLKNTLVSLPTGLGKTFIAAVVMYNFYRWYPTGKIIFMAPTRPLVKQQIDACYNIMAIPKETTAELTGTNVQDARNNVWKEKRVFFVTAQVLSNDLDRIADLGQKIKCLIFDEAHRAKGNYAYCFVIKKLLPKTKHFRVLALSATPGNNISDVEEVVQNLLISHIELRTEDSADVVPYTFKKNMETVVVPIGGKLTEIRDRYIQVLEKYTRVLLKHRVIQGNCSNLTKGKIFMTLKEFQEKNRSTRVEAYSEIVRNLNICITLYHGFELLIRHGLRGFLSFFQEHSEKPLLRGNVELLDIMRDVNEYLGPPPNISPLPDGTTTEIPENTRFGHPKFYKLCDILLAHFTEHHQNSSRVIVFCEYRESVMEAYALLLQQKPLIKPKVFIGQGGITQRQQLHVIQSFVQGECNTLISTSIGEEGLDVGEVDLIVCFDISNKSPVRMIQRIGRTGRKRDGRVVILVTEGKEEQTLKACLIQKHYLSKTILNSTELAAKLYKENSRMIPDYITPTCMKIHITVKKETKIKNETITGMFSRMENALTQGSSKKEQKDRIPDATEHWNKKDPLSINNDADKICFSKYLERQRKLQPTGIIAHSKQSDLLVSLLQFADSKRYNIPVTQKTSLLSQFTQVAKEKSKLPRTDSYKQSDLRSMLFKSNATTQKQVDGEAGINKTIADYLQKVARLPDICKICQSFFDCTHVKPKSEVIRYSDWLVPDIDALKSVNNETLDAFVKSLRSVPEEKIPEIEHEFSKNNSIVFEPPKGFVDVLKKCDSTVFENVDFTQIEKSHITTEDPQEVLRFFKLNTLEHLFKSPLQTHSSADNTIIYTPDQASENSSGEKLSPVLNKTQKSDPDSPVLCSYERAKYLKGRVQKKLFVGERKNATQMSDKPRLSNLLQKTRKGICATKNNEEHSSRSTLLEDSLFDDLDSTFCVRSESKKVDVKVANDSNAEILADIDDIFDTSFLSKGGSTVVPSTSKLDVLADINDICDTSFLSKGGSTVVPSTSKLDVLADINDICDLSVFEKTAKTSLNKNVQNSLNNHVDNSIDIGDICDISALVSENKTKNENKQSDISNLLDLDDICDLSLFKSTVSVKTKSQVFNQTKCEVNKTNLVENKSNTEVKQSKKVLPRKDMISKYKSRDNNKRLQLQSPQKCSSDLAKTFKTPKFNETSKSKNIDSILKKYTTPSTTVVSQQTQLSITQMLDIINKDDTCVGPKLSPDSENEFESRAVTKTKPKLSLKTNKPQNNTINLNFESDDDFEVSVSPKRKSKDVFRRAEPKNKTKKKTANPFLELEAEVSEGEGITVSADESVTDDDCLESSFVNDETQVFNNTQMHAHYLQSVRSPRAGRGFKIPKLPKMKNSEIFSQPVVDMDNTYMNDSFCVGSQELLQQNTEPCELEIAEKILRQERKRKRQKKAEKIRKKRVLRASDDSD